MPARKSDSGDAGKFTLIVVTCFPNKRYQQTSTINLTSRSLAYEQCDSLQRAFDEDCEPRRSYVLDTEGIPLRAGLAAYAPANHFFLSQERVRRYA